MLPGLQLIAPLQNQKDPLHGRREGIALGQQFEEVF
jgi:hypothetical protein